MTITVEIDGARQLQNQLHRLPGRIAGRVMRGALRSAAGVIRRRIMAEFRSRGYSRETRRAVRVRARRNPTPTSVRIEFEVDSTAFPLRFIELGVSTYTIAGSRRAGLGFRGSNEWVFFGRRVQRRQRSDPWMRPAFDASVNEVVETFRQRLGELIDRELQRLANARS